MNLFEHEHDCKPFFKQQRVCSALCVCLYRFHFYFTLSILFGCCCTVDCSFIPESVQLVHLYGWVCVIIVHLLLWVNAKVLIGRPTCVGCSQRARSLALFHQNENSLDFFLFKALRERFFANIDVHTLHWHWYCLYGYVCFFFSLVSTIWRNSIRSSESFLGEILGSLDILSVWSPWYVVEYVANDFSYLVYSYKYVSLYLYLCV